MVFALIKDNVMAQLASVYVIKVLKESIVKVIFERLKFYHYEKYMPKHDIFLDKSCPGGSPPCNGNGQCNHTTGLCTCNEGNQGSDCSGNSYNLWWITIMCTTNLSSPHKSQLFLPCKSLGTMYIGFSLKNCRFPCESLKTLINICIVKVNRWQKSI